ncbi:ABC transporter substrate-binding protein [Paenibacillus roseipurpureus]|uniref:Sugar ABC transporter substrate-binding protein n=1 Tax=Paenibacillus roseopurpureus TaxID=2918901 RepID=A0AA96RJF7_9BACL|nr:sugar ABC transporter substrate-binding protein [Paenibacillus sp. MBLB1832]WNR43264.1 sugar ABC transporter substrate-binding protein [Paenibacillus sp. MBLB1832]
MKKVLGMSASLALAVSVFVTGCSKTAEVTPSASIAPAATAAAATPTPEAQKPVTLKFWGGVPPESGPQEAVDNWNKANPNIKVEYTRYVNDDPGNLKLETALLSNTDAPDIFMNYGDDKITKRQAAGMAEPLDDLIAKVGFDVEGIIGASNIKKFADGKYYYLPANKNLGAVLFNKKALDEAGEKLPTAWTWDDFSAMATKLNKGDRKGTMLDPALAWFGDLVLQTSKPQDWFITADGTSNFNSPAAKKGLELQQSLESKGVMMKYSEAVAGKITVQNELLTGKAAMAASQIYIIRYIKDTKSFPHDFKVSFAPYPQFTAGGNVNPGGGMGDYMSINKNSKNKEAAMKFMSWYLQEGNMSMVPGGRIPTNKKADASKIASILIGDAKDLIDEDSLKALLAGSYTFPTSYNVPVPTELKAIFKDEMEKYLLGVQPIDKALETMKTRADASIKGAKK